MFLIHEVGGAVGRGPHHVGQERVTACEKAFILAATAGARHVRIRIRVPGIRNELIAVLGHELQHALEIAAAPDVRDAATFRAHYLRIGYERVNGGYYETEAAIEAGRKVAAELAAPPAAHGTGVWNDEAIARDDELDRGTARQIPERGAPQAPCGV